MDLKHQHLWTAPSLGIFLRKIAIDYVRFGYTNYMYREIPEYKDPAPIDQKIIEHYRITWDRSARLRARKRGQANLVYIRWKQKWILLATAGTHDEFYKRDHRDILTQPLSFSGYSVGIGQNGKVYVRVAPKRFSAIKKAVKNISLHNQAKVTGFINSIAYINFPAVIRQKQELTRIANERRKVAGLRKIVDPMSLIKRESDQRKALKLKKAS